MPRHLLGVLEPSVVPLEQVMHGHFALFAALFVESQPTAGAIVLVIIDPEFQSLTRAKL